MACASRQAGLGAGARSGSRLLLRRRGRRRRPHRGRRLSRIDGVLMEISPRPVLALLVGLFYTGVYIVIRGVAGRGVLLLARSAIRGAFAGQALGMRLGDPVQIGDFGLVWSALVSWLGIILIVAASTLAPARTGQHR